MADTTTRPQDPRDWADEQLRPWGMRSPRTVSDFTDDDRLSLVRLPNGVEVVAVPNDA